MYKFIVEYFIKRGYWGQNNEGQLGSIVDCGFKKHSMLRKKMKINYPRLIVPLKDTLITAISCGHTRRFIACSVNVLNSF